MWSVLFFFLKIVFANWGLLWFCVDLGLPFLFLQKTKNYHWEFYGNFIESIDSFAYFNNIVFQCMNTASIEPLPPLSSYYFSFSEVYQEISFAVVLGQNL